jgi:O-antigen/teichoic acid export membrane protein
LVKKKALFYLSSEFLSRGTTFLSTLAVAAIFTKEIFGLLTLYLVTFELFTIFISNGINAEARINFFKLNNKNFKRTNLIHLFNSLLACFIIIIIGSIAFTDSLYEIVLLSISAFFRSIFLLTLAMLQCKEIAKSYFKLNISYTVLFNSLFIFFLFFNFKIFAWIYALTISYSITSLICVKFYFKEYFKNFIFFSKKEIKNQFFSGLIFFPQAIGFWLRTGSERYYLSIFATMSILGAYAFNFQLSLPIVIFGNAINIYLTPIIANLVKSNQNKDIFRLLKKYARLTISTSIIFVFIAFIISKYFFYEKYYDSFNMTLWLTMVNLFYVLILLFLNPLYYMGEKKFVSKIIFSYGVFLAILNYFIVKYFSVYELIIFNLVTNIVVFLISYFYLKSKLITPKKLYK